MKYNQVATIIVLSSLAIIIAIVSIDNYQNYEGNLQDNISENEYEFDINDLEYEDTREDFTEDEFP